MSLDIEQLSVDLEGRRIVDHVTIPVADGQMVGLLGPNGCGKSTLLKAVYRAHRPATGQVLLDGEDLLAMPARQAAQRIAIVAQETPLEFELDVLEMVMIGRTPHKGAFDRDTPTDVEIVTDALRRVGCLELADRSIHTLSGGERQRVLIARALAQGADHLLLDEPTNHLDIRYQTEVLELVASLGLTVLTALHDLSLAALFCDTVHLMTDGRLIAGGAPRDVINPELIKQAYGADVLVVEHPEAGTPQLLLRRRS
ncbi:MAG TPA: ABC transporter ATP-binding protein [Mycobacteriales bacterium]|nr:ABC transporter ATP-binding protein [Mycobacteriales bacterium]